MNAAILTATIGAVIPVCVNAVVLHTVLKGQVADTDSGYGNRFTVAGRQSKTVVQKARRILLAAGVTGELIAILTIATAIYYLGTGESSFSVALAITGAAFAALAPVAIGLRCIGLIQPGKRGVHQ